MAKKKNDAWADIIKASVSGNLNKTSMDYKTAIEQQEKYQYLVGKTKDGMKVVSVHIIPSNDADFTKYSETLRKTKNQEAAITPFKNSPLEVVAMYNMVSGYQPFEKAEKLAAYFASENQG